MLPTNPARQPLLRKSDKLAIAIALAAFALAFAGSVALAGSATPTSLQERGFNPQPDPPHTIVGLASRTAK
ncbi:MAG: hypothetical protein GY717_08635 [Rhodobacteraceae bacterium]|nr:hypothetical protein [Paracoccaceae bacterium]